MDTSCDSVSFPNIEVGSTEGDDLMVRAAAAVGLIDVAGKGRRVGVQVFCHPPD